MPLSKRGRKTRRLRRRARLSNRHRRKFPGRQHGGTSIPKKVIQTAKEPLPEKNVQQLKEHLGGSEYTFFSDEDVMKFMTENPIPEFPDSIEKFKAIRAGPHKADFFRYYYIYVNGGVFIDGDLMLYENIDTILGTSSFVSVWALRPADSAFNGFLAATPKHPIVYAALKDMYEMSIEALEADYTIVCKHLGDIVRANSAQDVKMLREISNNDVFCNIEDPISKKIVMIHYQSMEIPVQATAP